jgi:hypothetical protein
LLHNHTPASPITLADLRNQRSLTMEEVLAWASAIAAELCTLHDLGRWHGAVQLDNVSIDGDKARLAPGPGLLPVNQPLDIQDFAALLRKMLESVPETEGSRAQRAALEGIANSNSTAASGSRMRKVALALKLVLAARRAAAPVRIATPVEQPPQPKPAPRKVLMLIREVPPPVPVAPRRFAVGNIHVFALLASAATIAIVGCLLFLRLVR